MVHEVKLLHVKESERFSTYRYIIENKSLSLGIFILSIIVIFAIFADFIAPYHYAERSDNCGEEYATCRYAPPSKEHPFGTSILGFDMLSRIIYGSRIALQMSIAATVLALIVGIPMGVLSGYYGGAVDRIFNSIADAIYSFPSLLIAITLSIALTEYANLGIILAVAVSTAFVYFPLYFKVARAQVLSTKSEAYVDAARSIGASNFTIIVKYILPNIIAAPLVLIPFNMTEAILTNAGLAFLGLSVKPPTPDWGYDVFDNKDLASVRVRPWLVFYPGLMIFLLSFAYSLVGDALNDKFDPYLKKEQGRGKQSKDDLEPMIKTEDQLDSKYDPLGRKEGN